MTDVVLSRGKLGNMVLYQVNTLALIFAQIYLDSEKKKTTLVWLVTFVAIKVGDIVMRQLC